MPVMKTAMAMSEMKSQSIGVLCFVIVIVGWEVGLL
jgi:hypothetical protein